MKRLIIILICILTLPLGGVGGDILAQKKNKTTKPVTTSQTKKSTKNSKKTATPTNAAIKGLRGEQAKIRQNIKKQEQALRANKAQVKQKLNDLMTINGEMDRHQHSIDSLNTEVNTLNSQLSTLQSQLTALDKELQDRKSKYVKSMRYMARQRGIQSQLMFIFSGKDFRQIFRRLRFVREYAAYQRTQGKAVQEQQALVTQKHQQVTTVKGEKNVLLRKGQKEQAVLADKKVEQQNVVNSLQKQQKTIQAVIDEQKKKDAALNAQIDKLVAQEVEKARQRAIAEAKKKAEAAAAAKKKAEELARKKAAAEAAAKENARRIAEAKAAEEKAKAEAKAIAQANAEAKANAAKEKAKAEQLARAEQRAREAEAARIAAERKAKADREKADKEVAQAKKESDNAVMLSSADRIISGGFEANKGRLPSPVAGGRVVSHFGQHGVEGLQGVVLDNKGINIRGAAGSAARSIYDGEVSAVFNVGGTMGVLVRHGAYISVYCNLSSVCVSRGQKVSARQSLGTVGRDNILQFQLRRERDKLNPEVWIAR